MLANTTKLPSEKMNTNEARRHMSDRSCHTSGIGIPKITESVRMLNTPATMKASFKPMHVYNRHQQQHSPGGVCGAEASGRGEIYTPGTEGSHAFSIGLHWKTEVGSMTRTQPTETEPVTSTTHLIR